MSLILVVLNDATGTKATGNYEISAYINNTPIWAGRIEDFPRSAGWEELLTRIAEKAKKEKRGRVQNHPK